MSMPLSDEVDPAPQGSRGAGALTAAATRDPARLLLHIAWLAIALGLSMHLLNVLAVGLAGAGVGAWAAQLRDFAQKVTWSTFVCLGVGLGIAAGRARAAWTGLAGLLAAPVAFVAARAVHKGVGGAVGLAPPAVMGPAVFWTVMALKAMQYAAFGAVLAHLGARASARLRTFALAGLLAGLIFGGTVVALLYRSAAQPPAAAVLAAQLVNEVVFPVGCACVVYAAARLGARLQK